MLLGQPPHTRPLALGEHTWCEPGWGSGGSVGGGGCRGPRFLPCLQMNLHWSCTGWDKKSFNGQVCCCPSGPPGAHMLRCKSKNPFLDNPEKFLHNPDNFLCKLWNLWEHSTAILNEMNKSSAVPSHSLKIHGKNGEIWKFLGSDRYTSRKKIK